MPDTPLVINGWKIFAHPLFLDQFENLIQAAETKRAKDPQGYTGSAAAKKLKAVGDLVFSIIPSDPAHPKFRQGGTLGEEHKHWFRAKFFERYRLFFRYRTDVKVIVYAWLNDEDSLRAKGSRNDPYAVFQGMLAGGNPPDDWG
ncbi:MAG TPA: type II toxin-antitoxin system YhaV family toxin [Candidatus Omnitrophota bacterium]|nr:type II toxin-antitoxin system YhaV family toxin [Candidatus Omnitrophota bacterium]